MSMTGTDIATRARVETNDNEAPNYRHATDANLLLFINDGVKHILDLRADANYTSAGALITLTELSAITGTISISDRFRPALTEYVIHRLWLCPSGSTENSARSTEAYNRFLAHLGLRGS